jgi:collagenase-like PrtC family protease
MKKPELLLPAGNEICLRAAVNNGADAVYIGLNNFSARRLARNFNEKNISSVISYCHERNVKVYIAFNTLIKNSEINEYFDMISIAYSAKADAIIIQDPCFMPIIKKKFPNLRIHLSTQATTLNSFSVPENVDRVILARELSFNEIKSISQKYETEVFVHGALCFSYSGLCLFSSIAGGRSGNRGMCAQPCRKLYNNKYLLSTMDLCLLEKIPDLIKAGVSSLKIEGRMRSPVYIAAAARIYRKYIDLYFKNPNSAFEIEEKDMEDLKLVFNREFTTGFAFNSSIVDSRMSMNRGLYLGNLNDGKIKLRSNLKIGDGIAVWKSKDNDKNIGFKIKSIKKDNKIVEEAFENDIVELFPNNRLENGVSLYKTSSTDRKLYVGDEMKEIKNHENETLQKNTRKITLPDFKSIENISEKKLFVKIYDKESALSADKAKADIIYYDTLKEDCIDVKNSIKNSRFFVYSPRIMSDDEIIKISEKIKKINPDGVLVGNRGLLKIISKEKYEIHLDYSFNCFNDIDINFYNQKNIVPIISPELNFQEISELKNKNFIVLVHGDICLMTTKQKLNSSEIIDEEKRHFRVRTYNNMTEILNSKQLGLFNKVLDYEKSGIKYFYIDLHKEPEKFVRIYKKILNKEPFDDKKIRKGYTTGQFSRIVG